MHFEDSEIENLRKVYNREHSDTISAGPARHTWNELKKRFSKKCNEDMCVITSMMKKPDAPDSWATNPNEWLSSEDIEAVEKEYTKLFSEYYYVGTFPIDFGKKSKTGQCLVSSLCSLSLESLYKKGFSKIGIVFNTDVSTGPGKHWVALFCNIDPDNEKSRITYFDSYGHRPEKEIQLLMKRWGSAFNSDLTYNKIRHQYQDSECGMYCLYFHFCSLTGLPMEKRIPDEVVRGMRSMLFRINK